MLNAGPSSERPGRTSGIYPVDCWLHSICWELLYFGTARSFYNALVAPFSSIIIWYFFSLFCWFTPVGQDIRDRFSGAVEAFSRRNASSSARHGEHTRHRSEDVPSSKDVVFVFHIDILIPHSSLCSVLLPFPTISHTHTEKQYAWLMYCTHVSWGFT